MRWCDFCEENLDHLFWGCNLVQWGWLFVFKWWNMANAVSTIRHLSLDSLMKLHGNGIVNQIWRMVVGGTCWSIWLARNDNIFNNVKIKKETLELLIFTRISKWGAAAKLTPFTDDPIWKVNPQGIIKIHYNKVNLEFWSFKRISFKFISAVDGAWGINEMGYLTGSIGGNIKDRNGVILHAFSGQVNSRDSADAEIEAIKYVISVSLHHIFEDEIILICSDSLNAISTIRSGKRDGLPILLQNRDIRDWIKGKIVLAYVPRYLNEEADSLAKTGLQRPRWISYWAQ